MNEEAINKAVDDWIEMERKAKAWDRVWRLAESNGATTITQLMTDALLAEAANHE